MTATADNIIRHFPQSDRFRVESVEADGTFVVVSVTDELRSAEFERKHGEGRRLSVKRGYFTVHGSCFMGASYNGMSEFAHYFARQRYARGEFVAEMDDAYDREVPWLRISGAIDGRLHDEALRMNESLGRNALAA